MKDRGFGVHASPSQPRKLKMTSFPMQEKYEAHSGMYQGLVGKFGGLEQQNIALELDMIPHSSRS